MRPSMLSRRLADASANPRHGRPPGHECIVKENRRNEATTVCVFKASTLILQEFVLPSHLAIKMFSVRVRNTDKLNGTRALTSLPMPMSMLVAHAFACEPSMFAILRKLISGDIDRSWKFWLCSYHTIKLQAEAGRDISKDNGRKGHDTT